MNPGKMVPGKLVPWKLRNEKSWGGRRASWCVCRMLRCDQSIKNPKLDNKPITRTQKIVGWASSIVVYVWNERMWSIYENSKLDNKHTTQKKTQNSETKNRRVSVEHRGMCVERSDVINLWNPKTRQQIFLDSFSVLQFGAYIGSWRKRRTSFCVCSGINW